MKTRPKVLIPSRRQTGVSKNPVKDSKLKAMSAGKRMSKTGKVYYEYRRNRSDVKNLRGTTKKRKAIRKTLTKRSKSTK